MNSISWLIGLDHSLFFWLNGMSAWTPVALAAQALSHFGGYVMILIAGVALSRDGWRAGKPRFLAILAMAGLALAFNHGTKEWLERARPLKFYQVEVARNEVTILAGEKLMRNSFPSGHTTLAFLTMGYVAWSRRRHAAWALALAAAVGWSRVAMGSHFPSDCIAGAILGLFWSWLAWRLGDYLERAAWMNRVTTASPESSSGSC
jgi:undecaprenyl-diphosphatase